MTVILRLPLARVATLIALASLFVTLHAQAARPFVTDDARLTTAGSCQLESWIRICPESRESWAQPACNPGGKASYAGERATRDDVCLECDPCASGMGCDLNDARNGAAYVDGRLGVSVVA